MRGLPPGSVLLFTYGFEPVHNFSVELFLDGDMGHGGGESGPVPVFFAGGKPDDIAGTDLLDGRAFALSQAAAGGDDQRLAERVGMPCGSRARLEGDACTLNECWIRSLEERIDPYCAGEPIGGSFGGGLRTVAFDLHVKMISQRGVRIRAAPDLNATTTGYLTRCGCGFGLR